MPGTRRTRYSRIFAAVAALLLLLATTSCGHMDDIMDEAKDVIDEAGDVVDALRSDGDDGDHGSTSESGGNPSSGGQTVIRPPKPTGTVATGAPTPLTSSPIGPNGGTVTVQKPGDPLDGLEIQVPPGSYPDNRQFEISSAAVNSHTFGQYFTPATPLISIENGGDYADELMSVTIPVEVPTDHFAMAFYYDGATGTLEGIPFSAIDEHSITIVTRHFCDIIVSIVSNSVLDDLMKSDIDSHFRPGIDDWQFTNYGSYIAKKGHCAGQSITAMWYFCEQPDGKDLTLNGRYDNNGNHPSTPNLWVDDSHGYRFASTIQNDAAWQSYGVKLQMSLRGTDDAMHYKAFAYSIQLTGEPQYVGIGSEAGGGHAMVAYRVHDGHIYIADPNYPGNTERRIEFSDGRFKPYNSGENAAEIAAGNGKAYELIGYRAKTSMVDWNLLSSRWSEFKAGTIGNDRFPQYNVVVPVDTFNKEPLVDGYESEHKKIGIEVDAAFPVAWQVFRNGTEVPHDADWKYELEDGNNALGVLVWGDVNNNPQSRRWRYVDFQYINVQYGEEECYGWMLDSVTVKEYFEMPSDAYSQNLVFQASETGSFSGSGSFFVYDPDPSGSADDIYAHHTTSGTWTPPPSCIPPDEPVYLEMHCTSELTFEQPVEWGTLYTYLNIYYNYGGYGQSVAQQLDHASTFADGSAIAEIRMYEGFEDSEPQEIRVQCGSQEGNAEYVYTYVWKG